MKKIYIAPETYTTNVNLHQMLAASPLGGQVNNEQAESGASGFVKENAWEDIWDDGSEETEYDY